MLDSLVSSASPDVLSRSAAHWERRGPDFGGDVRALAAALIGYGLTPGAPVAVLGPEGHDTLCAELAVLAAGAVLISLDPALTDGRLSEALATTAAAQAIASDESQLARLLSLRPDLPALDLVLLMRAKPSERKPAALLAAAAMAAGRAALAEEPALLRGGAAGGGPGDALVVFEERGPSRVTSRAELAALARALSSKLGLARGRSILCAVPRGSTDRLAVAVAAAAADARLLLASPGDRPDAGLTEQNPDVIVLSAESLVLLHESWNRDIGARSWFGRTSTGWALRQGANPSAAGWKRGLAERLALRDLRRKLGGRVERLDVAAAGPPARTRDSETFFESVGLTVRFLAHGGSEPLAR